VGRDVGYNKNGMLKEMRKGTWRICIGGLFNIEALALPLA